MANLPRHEPMPVTTSPDKQSPGRPPLRFPNLYVWLVFVSALDVMLTLVVLHLGGGESNPVARAVIERLGLPGMCGFKFAIIFAVICLCEFIGKRDARAAERLAVWSIALTVVPLVVALAIIRGGGG